MLSSLDSLESSFWYEEILASSERTELPGQFQLDSSKFCAEVCGIFSSRVSKRPPRVITCIVLRHFSGQQLEREFSMPDIGGLLDGFCGEHCHCKRYNFI